VVIAGLISANSVHAAPTALTSSIAATTLKGPMIAASTMALVKGTLNAMTWIKMKTAIVIGASTVLVASAGTVLMQEQQNRSQEEQIRAEEQQIRAQEQQPGISDEQRAKLETRLAELRATHDQLRKKQNQLYEQNTNAFVRPSLHISPFTMVRFEGENVMVKYNGTEYQLAAIDDTSTSDFLGFCEHQYGDAAQKRFAEDLVVVLGDMGKPLNADDTVSLKLINPATGRMSTIDKAPMTEENRQAIMKSRYASQ
jgi:hypothetical protein